jgi:hypothetical protein
VIGGLAELQSTLWGVPTADATVFDFLPIQHRNMRLPNETLTNSSMALCNPISEPNPLPELSIQGIFLRSVDVALLAPSVECGGICTTFLNVSMTSRRSSLS